ncbi:MAG: pilus assembly protein N-terminal domain-containing protein, partial [Stellaceae bacterium]
MRRGGLAALAGLSLSLMALPAVAADIVTDSGKSMPKGEAFGLPVTSRAQSAIALEVSQGKLIVLPAPASNVFVADPTVADIQLANADHVFVFGKKSGRTTVYALGVDGILLRAISVDVSNPTGRAQQLTSLTPGAGDIHVGTTVHGLVLEGHAADPAAAALAQRAATVNAPEKAPIDDRVRVRSSVQVTLRVRIAEVSRTVTKQLGINWNAIVQTGAFQYGLFTGRNIFNPLTGPGAFPPFGAFAPATPLQSAGQPGSIFGGVQTSSMNVNAVIDALSEEGLVTILAEPTLTAISGEPASFL